MQNAKYFLFILLILIIGGCTYIAVQPNSYDVYRNRTINAPVELIFNNINDYKNWEAWSPWIENDPSVQLTFPKQTSGVGGSYSWTSDDGPGTIKTLDVSPYDSINQQMQFDDFPPSNIYWKFKKVDNGVNVTWGMKADKINFFMKLYSALNGGMDKMVGPDFERGLVKLDSVLVESMKVYNITVNGITEYGGGFYLYKTTNATNANISQVMGQQYGSIAMYMGKNDIAMNGMPMTIYHEMNMEDGNVVMSNGIPVSEKIEINDDSGILCGFIPNIKVLKVTLKGNYSNLTEAWETAMKHVSDSGLVQSEEKPFEIYTNDPGQFPNPADWITEIYIPVVE